MDPAASVRTGWAGRRRRRRKGNRCRPFGHGHDSRPALQKRLAVWCRGLRKGLSHWKEGAPSSGLWFNPHTPGGCNRRAENLRDRLAEALTPLPAHLDRSPSWEQGIESACHHEFTWQTPTPVYSCNFASPWQPGSNETLMVSCGHTFRKEQIRASTLTNTWLCSQSSSISDHVRFPEAEPLPSALLDCSHLRPSHKLLRRPLNSAALTMANASAVADSRAGRRFQSGWLRFSAVRRLSAASGDPGRETVSTEL